MTSTRIALALICTLVATPLSAGGFCRNHVAVQNIANLAVVQPDYYYAIQPQVRAPFVYGGDVDSLLNARKELLRLSTGLNTADVQAQTQLLTLPVQAPAHRAQRVESASGCSGKCQCEKCPPNCKNCRKIEPDPAVPAPEATPETRPASNLDAQAIDVLTRYKCTQCHGKVKPDGGFSISTGGEVIDLSRGDRFEIHGKTAHNEMPPPGKGEPLTAEDLDILYRWANSKGR